MIHATEITLHTGAGLHIFMLENAAAWLKGHTFTVLAERIERVEPEALAEMAG